MFSFLSCRSADRTRTYLTLHKTQYSRVTDLQIMSWFKTVLHAYINEQTNRLLTVLLVHQDFKGIHLIVLKCLPDLVNCIFVCQLSIHKTAKKARNSSQILNKDTTPFVYSAKRTYLETALLWFYFTWKANLTVAAPGDKRENGGEQTTVFLKQQAQHYKLFNRK